MPPLGPEHPRRCPPRAPQRLRWRGRGPGSARSGGSEGWRTRAPGLRVSGAPGGLAWVGLSPSRNWDSGVLVWVDPGRLRTKFLSFHQEAPRGRRELQVHLLLLQEIPLPTGCLDELLKATECPAAGGKQRRKSGAQFQGRHRTRTCAVRVEGRGIALGEQNYCMHTHMYVYGCMYTNMHIYRFCSPSLYIIFFISHLL
nr:uncharacterized protein LOC129042593 [Pongo pygmaeus]